MFFSIRSKQRRRGRRGKRTRRSKTRQLSRPLKPKRIQKLSPPPMHIMLPDVLQHQIGAKKERKKGKAHPPEQDPTTKPAPQTQAHSKTLSSTNAHHAPGCSSASDRSKEGEEEGESAPAGARPDN